MPDSGRIQVEHRVTVQRSRFHAVLASVDDMAQVQAILKERRRAVKRACHHCWACRLHEGGQLAEHGRDDGEVGRPGRVLLDRLRLHALEQSLIVVSRVFGGVKLGPGGVARAFRAAADGVLAEYVTASTRQGLSVKPRQG